MNSTNTAIKKKSRPGIRKEANTRELSPRMISIKDIILNPDNPRLISDTKIKKLSKSIKVFPALMEIRPIVINSKNIIIGGNMRFRAIQSLGMEEIPDSWIKKADKLTKSEERRFIIEDNLSFGEFDWDILANEWDEKELINWGMDLPINFGIGEAQEDDYEMPDEIKTDIKLGDLFEIGRHRLLCGDCSDIAQMQKLMNGNKIDMVFTDPPYGVSIGAKNRFLNSLQPYGRNLNDIKDDNVSIESLKGQLIKCFKNIKEVSNNCCAYFVTAPQGGQLSMMMMLMMMEAGLIVKHVLIWKKNKATFSMGRLDYNYQHEPILFTWNKNHKFYGKGKFKTSIWEIDSPRSSKEHPTMKPVELVANALLNNSKPDDIINDSFLGSGTTMVACEQLNRICYGMEIEPKYCQVIIDRMLKLDPEIKITKNKKPYKR
jgi:DNA modification methylase